MSQQYDNNNRFVLFPNDRKQTDKHPDLSGTINIDGKDHFFDGWFAKDGSGRINGKIGNAKMKGGNGGGQRSSAPRQRQELGASQRHSPSRGSSYDDDDIPFRQHAHKEY